MTAWNADIGKKASFVCVRAWYTIVARGMGRQGGCDEETRQWLGSGYCYTCLHSNSSRALLPRFCYGFCSTQSNFFFFALFFNYVLFYFSLLSNRNSNSTHTQTISFCCIQIPTDRQTGTHTRHIALWHTFALRNSSRQTIDLMLHWHFVKDMERVNEPEPKNKNRRRNFFVCVPFNEGSYEREEEAERKNVVVDAIIFYICSGPLIKMKNRIRFSFFCISNHSFLRLLAPALSR